jgi:FMN reductase
MKTKIVGICGSLNKESSALKILKVLETKLRVKGAEEVLIVNLRDLRLPFCNGEKNYPEYPDVQYLWDIVSNANGLILATPEYHGGFSGVLKNTLDLLRFEDLSGKVTGVVSVLGGAENSNALNELRLVMRSVHAWVIPEQIAVAQARKAFSFNGELLDEKLSHRCDGFAESLVKSIKKMN